MEKLLWMYGLTEIKTYQSFTEGDEMHAHNMSGQSQIDMEQLQKFRDSRTPISGYTDRGKPVTLFIDRITKFPQGEFIYNPTLYLKRLN